MAELKNGPSRKRVGLQILKGAPARDNTPVLDETGRQVGYVTSGTLSPSLGKPIAMAYVESAVSANGTKLRVDVRGRVNEAEVCALPFVPSNYYRVPK